MEHSRSTSAALLLEPDRTDSVATTGAATIKISRLELESARKLQRAHAHPLQHVRFIDGDRVARVPTIARRSRVALKWQYFKGRLAIRREFSWQSVRREGWLAILDFVLSSQIWPEANPRSVVDEKLRELWLSGVVDGK